MIVLFKQFIWDSKDAGLQKDADHTMDGIGEQSESFKENRKEKDTTENQQGTIENSGTHNEKRRIVEFDTLRAYWRHKEGRNQWVIFLTRFRNEIAGGILWKQISSDIVYTFVENCGWLGFGKHSS